MEHINSKQLSQKSYMADKLNQRFAVMDALFRIMINDHDYDRDQLIDEAWEIYRKCNNASQEKLVDYINGLYNY